MDHGRTANKRPYSTMAQSHRADHLPSFLDFSRSSQAPPDDHYYNPEHQSQRRRINTPDPVRPHFPGDGYDFRRPVMPASSTEGTSGRAMQNNPDTIDLTDGGHDRSMRYSHLALPRPPSDMAGAEPLGSSSRAQRLPRFERNIIDLADSDDEAQPQQQQPPQTYTQHIFEPHAFSEDDSLFIPESHPRPTTAGLRRPGFMRQPSPATQLDDVEIVGSRPLSRHHSRRATPANASRRTATPMAHNANTSNNNATIDLTADDDEDEVIHTDTRTLPGINGDRPGMAGSGIGTRDQPVWGGIGRLVQRMRGTRGGVPGDGWFGQYTNFGNDGAARLEHQEATRRRADAARQTRQALEAQVNELFGDAGAPPTRPRHVAAVRMDYNIVGFDLGFGIAPNRPPTPKYEPPPPAEKGFTRTPAEDEEVVCPNCGDELAVGKDEVKQQVYVVKSCGHAYCGECATRERASASKKGKGKALDPSIPPPLKKCVVVGCGKSALKNHMVHVFMSS
ncbi:hypothetical protein WHR41_01122 [Cladosporium halotolerans]|uniref:RING-type domain-containing protein n=1 Tax=Cladosporium halotolerans TaxID=1052096 RepID=A0AB34L1G0_9PEZI